MYRIVVILAILAAVLGTGVVHAEQQAPTCIASADAGDARINRPQTRAWFEEVTGFESFCPPTFTEAVAELDAYWDAEAQRNCKIGHCYPRFGQGIPASHCSWVEFRRGDVFWGGWYDPNNLPTGIEALVLSEDGWSGVYRITVDHFNIPPEANCAGGRFLRELKFVFAPNIRR